MKGNLLKLTPMMTSGYRSQSTIEGRRTARARVGFASTAAFAVAALVFGSVTAAHADDESAASVVAEVAPEVLVDADVTSAADASALEYANPESVTAEIPVDPADPITIADGLLSIGLPNGEAANNATSNEDGIVEFENNDGSATVPIVKEDGSIQILTVIDNSDAPTRYDYEIGTPGESTLTVNEDGSVNVTEADGTVAATIAAPWAKDSNGESISTWYEVEGSTLTQVVEHTAAAAYPVVADPTVFYCAIAGWYPGQCIKLNRYETQQAANALAAGVAGTAAVTSHFCGKVGNVAVRVACIGAAAAVGWSNINNITTAAREGKCVQFAFTYPLIAQLMSGGIQKVSC